MIPSLRLRAPFGGTAKTARGDLKDDKVGQPVLFVWHNYFTSGEYSNITWSIDDAQA